MSSTERNSGEDGQTPDSRSEPPRNRPGRRNMMGAPPPGQGGFRVRVDITPPNTLRPEDLPEFWAYVREALNRHAKESGSSGPQLPLLWQKSFSGGTQTGYLLRPNPDYTQPDKVS